MLQVGTGQIDLADQSARGILQNAETLYTVPGIQIEMMRRAVITFVIRKHYGLQIVAKILYPNLFDLYPMDHLLR